MLNTKKALLKEGERRGSSFHYRIFQNERIFHFEMKWTSQYSSLLRTVNRIRALEFTMKDSDFKFLAVIPDLPVPSAYECISASAGNPESGKA